MPPLLTTLEACVKGYNDNLTPAFITGGPDDEHIGFLDMPSATLPDGERYTAMIHPCFIWQVRPFDRIQDMPRTNRAIVSKFRDLPDADILREAEFHLHYSKTRNNLDYAAGARALHEIAPALKSIIDRRRAQDKADIVISPTPKTTTP